MKIKITLPDGKKSIVTLPDGYSKEQIEDAVQNVLADYDLKTGAIAMLPGDVEAEANAPARERQAIQSQMGPAIQQARREAGTVSPSSLPEWLVPDPSSFPYLREAYATGNDPEVGALRDLAALPGKGYGAVMDLFSGEDPRRAMAMTSDELSAEDRTGRSILANPSLVPSILTALYTGGMSIPTQIGGQVAANAVFQPGYGEGDVAVDAALTALPAGASLVAGKAKASGIAAIKKALESKGLQNVAPDVLERAYNSLLKGRTGEKLVQESGEALAKDIAGPAAGATDVPKSGILRRLSRNAPIEIPANAFDRARKAIMESVKVKGGRSLDEAQEAISRVNTMEATQNRIAALQESGGYSPEAYTRDVVEALKRVADIPEIVKEAEGYISTAAARRNQDEVQRVFSAAFGRPAGLIANNIPDASFSQPLQNLRTGAALRDIYGSQGRGVLDVISEPTVAARDFVRSPGAKYVTEKGLRATAPVAPSVLNRLYYSQGETK